MSTLRTHGLPSGPMERISLAQVLSQSREAALSLVAELDELNHSYAGQQGEPPIDLQNEGAAERFEEIFIAMFLQRFAVLPSEKS